MATGRRSAGRLVGGRTLARRRGYSRRVCTVVFTLAPGTAVPLRVLAIRDELVSRSFALPDTHWPRLPNAFGGRDLKAGGTWCASDIASGTTSALLNRPERMDAAEGAPSRGEL